MSPGFGASSPSAPAHAAIAARAHLLPLLPPCSAPQLATKLGELIKALQAVLSDLRSACEEISHGAARAKRSVDSSRRGLKAALAAHQAACRWALAALHGFVVSRRGKAGQAGGVMRSVLAQKEGCGRPLHVLALFIEALKILAGRLQSLMPLASIPCA